MEISTMPPYLQYSMVELQHFTTRDKEIHIQLKVADYCLLVITTGKVSYAQQGHHILITGDSLILQQNKQLVFTNLAQQTTGYLLLFNETITDDKRYFASYHSQVTRVKPFQKQQNQLQVLRQKNTHMSLEQHMNYQITFLSLLQDVYLSYQHQHCIGDAIVDVKRTIQHIQQNYNKKFNVSALAQQANLSPRQYLRVFKKITNTTPIDYINHFKIYRAQERLLTTSETVHQIAERIGIKDINYFNKLFKQVVGCTPRQYRNKITNSEKIATLFYSGELLALNIKPIGDVEDSLHYLPTHNKGITPIGNKKCDIQKLQLLHPDIVITSDIMDVATQTHIAQFSPIITIPSDISPANRLLKIAQIIGKYTDAKQYMAEIEGEKRKIQAYYSERYFQQKAIVVKWDGTKLWYYAPRFFPVIYEVLCFVPATVTDVPSDALVKELTWQQLLLSDIDHIFLMVDNVKTVIQDLQPLMLQEEWMQLQAVKNQHISVVNSKIIATNVFAMQHQLTELLSNTEQHKEIFLGNLFDYINKNVKRHYVTGD